MCWLLLLSVTGLVCVSSASFVVVPASSTGGSSPDLKFSTHKAHNTTGYLAVVANPFPHFHVYSSVLSNGSCGGYIKTSKGAVEHGCLYATNGGPFSMGQSPTSATCQGHVISDDRTLWNGPTNSANFGVTRNGSFVLGELAPHDIEALHLSQLVTGFGWLVRDGKTVPTAGGEVAPRTALGVNKEGQLLVLEVDGVERESPPVGLTLLQLAVWLRDLGAVHAVNLDGGGSSVTVYKGKIVSRPSCIDIPVVCERSITTFICVK